MPRTSSKRKAPEHPWRNRIVGHADVSPTQVEPSPWNWRTHPTLQREAMGDLLTELGWIQQIIVNQRTNHLVDGHLRLALAIETHAETVPVVYVDLSEDEERLALATHDPLGAMAEASREALTQVLEQVHSGQASVQQLLSQLAEQHGVIPSTLGTAAIEDVEPQIDRAAELREQYGVEVGQLWACGAHRVICGDCMEHGVVERLMDGAIIEAVLTDPPYGLGWDTDYTRFASQLTKQTRFAPIIEDEKPFDPRRWLAYPKVILWGANWYCQHIPLGSWLVWDKRHATGAALLSDAELAWMKGKRGISLYAETLQGAIRAEHAMHPTQKPVGLMAWCLEKIEMPTIVLDPYLGSGTTLIACENLQRRCYGIEIDPGYVAVTLERWHKLTGELPTLLEG